MPVRRLVVAAVDIDHQGKGLGANRVSTHLLASALADGLDPEAESLVTATVAGCNLRSLALPTRHKISRPLSSTGDGYVDLVGASDEVLASLPDAKPMTEVPTSGDEGEPG